MGMGMGMGAIGDGAIGDGAIGDGVGVGVRRHVRQAVEECAERERGAGMGEAKLSGA